MHLRNFYLKLFKAHKKEKNKRQSSFFRKHAQWAFQQNSLKCQRALEHTSRMKLQTRHFNRVHLQKQ